MCQCLAYTLLFLSVQSSQNRSDCHLTSAASSLAVWFFLTATDRSLLFTHVCPATGFCRCCAFQIGKICCQNCIVRNFQFRKFLPVNSYPLSFIPSARQNVNEIFLIKITPFLYSKKRRHCKQVRRFLPNIGCWLSTDTEKIPAENLGQFVTECNASRNFE
mgnify:CR=1 FL=1